MTNTSKQVRRGPIPFDSRIDGVALEWVADNLERLGPIWNIEMHQRWAGLTDKKPQIEVVLRGHSFGDIDEWVGDLDVLDMGFDIQDCRDREAGHHNPELDEYYGGGKVPSFVSYTQTLTVRMNRPSFREPVTFEVKRELRLNEAWSADTAPTPPEGYPAEEFLEWWEEFRSLQPQEIDDDDDDEIEEEN